MTFDDSPIIGIGLNARGFGANLSRPQLSLEWLRQQHSVRELPISKADKERLVNGSSSSATVRDGIAYTHFPWCGTSDGWYVGEWVKKCKLSKQQREMVYTAHAVQMQTEQSESREAVEEKRTGDGEADGAIDLTSGRASDEEASDDEVDVVDAQVETLPEDGGDEEERDEAGTTTMVAGTDGTVEKQHISPLKLQRKRGRIATWQRHDCSMSCWQMRGYGYQITHGGVQFLGQFIGGALHDPQGVIIDSSGLYCGGVVNSADEGCGSFYYRANGDVFTGMWRQGTMEYGSVLYGDHSTLYTGAFEGNKQDGLGVFDVLAHPTENSILQHVGQWRAGTWNGVGKAVYTNRSVTGTWLKEGTVKGSMGLIEWVDEEEMKMTYVGEMSESSDGCGQGRLRWEERSAGEKRQQEHDDKRRAEAAARRKKHHLQRRAGDWSSITDIQQQQSALAEQIDRLSTTLETLPTVELPFTSPTSSLYVGAVQHSRAHGHGVRRWANGDIFSGHWVDGVCNGFGSWMSQDRHDSLGSILYSGCWKNDKEHGRGTLLSSMPLLGRMLFHGRFVDGWLTGMGSVYFADSGQLYYVGRMAGGAFDGEGVMRLDDGSLYIGAFVDGTFRGKGRWVDTRECSVYTGRFKHDYKHGCGRLTIHQRLEEGLKAATDILIQQKATADGSAQEADESASADNVRSTSSEATTASPAVPAFFGEQSDSETVRRLSATKSVTPEEALAACHHSIALPQSFGAAVRSYLAIYNRDKPVIRLVSQDMDELLEEIEYELHDSDVDEDGLVQEEQLDTAKEEKRKARQRKAGKSKVAAVEQPMQVHNGKEQEGEAEGQQEREQDIGEAAAELEANGMLILQHYQNELDRLHKQKGGRRGRPRKEKISTSTSSSSPLPAASTIRSTGTSFLRQSLSQPPPPLALFDPPASSTPIRRIHLGRAIAACSSHGVCSAAVTGQLPADYSVQYCLTCSRGGPGDEDEDEKRVEVCAACRAAGCHRGHEMRPVRVVEKGKEGDPTNGEAALFYCHCSSQHDKCKTKMRHFAAAIDRATLWAHERQHWMEPDTATASQPPLVQQSVADGREPTEDGNEPLELVDADDANQPLDSGASPAPLKPSELRARNAQFVQRAAPADAEPPSHSSASASASLPPPSSFRSLLSMLSSSSQAASASSPVLPLSLPAPVRKAGPRWIKVDGKWVDDKSC